MLHDLRFFTRWLRSLVFCDRVLELNRITARCPHAEQNRCDCDTRMSIERCCCWFCQIRILERERKGF